MEQNTLILRALKLYFKLKSRNFAVEKQADYKNKMWTCPV